MGRGGVIEEADCSAYLSLDDDAVENRRSNNDGCVSHS